MELSDDQLLQTDVQFRELKADQAQLRLQFSNKQEQEEEQCRNLANAVETEHEHKDESQKDNRHTINNEQLLVSDEYLQSIKQFDQAATSTHGKAGGKWKKRKRTNPFINFFLSMYSRRPRQRVAKVARQAGRHWGRMSDSQRKLYANLQGIQ